jgi:hypothetical protein
MLGVLNHLHAQGTAFTYQGQLQSGTNFASGSYDITFSIWTNPSGPSQVGNTVTNIATGVTNGLFTVMIDFGGGVFDGNPRWLEIEVCTNGGAFTTLSPRQFLTAAPYATYANTSGYANLASNLVPNVTVNPTFGSVTLGTFLFLTASTSSVFSGATLSPSTSYVVLTATTVATLNSVIAIANGTKPGQILILQGTSDNNNIIIPNGANTHLETTRGLGAHDTLTLIWDGTVWDEISYANNN